MGLVDLKTNLKSLRYGKDRIGGGSSGQPYIKTDIPESFSDVGRTGGPDVILRGGTLTPVRAARDVSRLTQMFFDFKSIGGPLFIAKENLLSRTSVATDGKGKALNNGVYLPTSTLLQSAGNPLGLHLNKQGIDPFKGIGQDGGGIFELFGGTDAQGQPTYTDPLGQPSYITITSNPDYKSKLLDFTDSKINTKTTSTELLNYQGGPGSNLGIGKTIIPLSKQRTGLNNLNLNYTKGSFELGSSSTLYEPSEYTSPTDKSDILLNLQTKLGATPKFVSLDPETQNNITEGWTSDNVGNELNNKLRPDRYNIPTEDNPSVQEDFRIKSDNPKTASFRLDYTGGDAKNIEKRVNLGNPGTKKTREQLANYQKGTGEALDKINAYKLYKSEGVTSDITKNDLVKFRIGIIQNDDPAEKVYIHFRAFIDSMSDDYSADWSSDKLMGRGENFYRYNGFDRKISLDWTVAAQSKDELIPMYQKLNYLASSLAPDYSKSLGYMRGNLATLTVGGWFYEQPGIITGLNLQIPEDSPWEIALPTKSGGNSNGGILSDRDVKEMPHRIVVSGFNFIPIHEFVPQIQKNNYSKSGKLTGFGKERYISLNNGYNNNYGTTTGNEVGRAKNYIK